MRGWCGPLEGERASQEGTKSFPSKELNFCYLPVLAVQILSLAILLMDLRSCGVPLIVVFLASLCLCHDCRSHENRKGGDFWTSAEHLQVGHTRGGMSYSSRFPSDLPPVVPSILSSVISVRWHVDIQAPSLRPAAYPQELSTV